MGRKHRKILTIAGGVCGVLLVMGIGTLYLLQTGWFKEKVRQKIISEVERTSGGRVEIGSFSYDWRNLTAECKMLAVHGTEPDDAPPLFRADSIRIGLKIVSLLKRDLTGQEVNIASLVVEHPRIYLVVRPDGTTNVPSPKTRRSTAKTVEELLKLKVRRFRINQGEIEVETRRVPFHISGENISVLLSYDFIRPQYNAVVSSNKVSFASDQFQPFSAELNAALELGTDRVVLQRFALSSKGSKLRAAGMLEHFAHPTVDLNLDAQVAASRIGQISKHLRDGEFTISGKAHYDEAAVWGFHGKVAGRDLVYRSNAIRLKDVNFESELFARRKELKFTQMKVWAPDGRFAGEAILNNFHGIQVNGKLSGFKVRDAGLLFPNRPFPWSGLANGPVHITGTLDGRDRNLAIKSDLQLSGEPGGIPVSGNVEVSYTTRGGILQFGNSHLAFPNTDIAFSGIWGGKLEVKLDSSNLADLKQVLALWSSSGIPRLPDLLRNGRAHFEGTMAGLPSDPRIQGDVTLDRFQMQGQGWDRASCRIDISSNALDFSSLVVDQGTLHATGRGRTTLTNWRVGETSQIRLLGQFSGVDVAKMASEYTAAKLPIVRGIASGAVDIGGWLNDPQGSARIDIKNVDAFGERLNEMHISSRLGGDQLQITTGQMQAGPAVISFSGAYNHVYGSWRTGQFHLKVDSNGFPLASLSAIRKYEPGLNAEFEAHGQAEGRVTDGKVQPTGADGTMGFRKVTVNNLPYGSVTLNATTHGEALNATFAGDLRESHLSGSAQVQLIPGIPAKGEFHLDHLRFATLAALLNSGQVNAFPFDGFLQGGFSFEGPLQQIERMHAKVELQEVQLTSNPAVELVGSAKPANLMLRNIGPVVLDASNGVAIIRSFEIGGKDTAVRVTGSIPYTPQRSMDLQVNGSVDLRIFQMFDRNLQSTGESVIAASVAGGLRNPSVNGTLQLKDGSFSFKNVPNGLSGVNGTIRLDRDRATIQKLTARTGGGQLSLAGFVSFGAKGPLVYRVEANADNVRMRDSSGISVTASSELRLTGTSQNTVLSGTITVSRVVFNPSTDIGNVLASFGASAAGPTNEKNFLTGLQFDVHVESTPNLQLSTALSRDVEAEIDLRLRGTPDHPVLLGSISANQGDIRVFGAKYGINRGEVSFANPAKIEPELDLDLQTEARGVTVDITISGTIGKLNINYRSDPPLQPRDIIALLTVGRAPNAASNIPNAQVRNDVPALQTGANTVLGQAIAPASNRLSKLFGITNIKIDPLVQGITNTPQARLSIEQQISREITVTYVTNLSQTSEQIFRVEWALSRQYSVVALRDENGEFGIDIQYKKRFK